MKSYHLGKYAQSKIYYEDIKPYLRSPKLAQTQMCTTKPFYNRQESPIDHLTQQGRQKNKLNQQIEEELKNVHYCKKRFHKNEAQINKDYRIGEKILEAYEKRVVEYNLFTVQEIVRQKLPICKNCSNNLIIQHKSQLCLQPLCSQQSKLICSCNQQHFQHKTINVMMLLQRLSLEQFPSINSETNKLIFMLKEVIQSLQELQRSAKMVIKGLEMIILDQEQFINKDFVARNIVQDLIENVHSWTQEKLQKELNNLCPLTFSNQINHIQPTCLRKYITPLFKQLNSLEQLLISYNPKNYKSTLSTHTPRLNQNNIAIYKILCNDFIGKKVTVNSSWNVQLGHVRQLDMIGDGHLKFSVGGAEVVKCGFIGKRNQKEVKGLLEMISFISKKKNFKRLELFMNYQSLNFSHSFLDFISTHIKGKQIKLQYQNVKSSDSFNKELWNYFRTYTRQMRSVDIKINYDRRQISDRKESQKQVILRNYIDVLGKQLFRFYFDLSINFSCQQEYKILSELIRKQRLIYLRMNICNQQNFPVMEHMFLVCQCREILLMQLAMIQKMSVPRIYHEQIIQLLL